MGWRRACHVFTFREPILPRTRASRSRRRPGSMPNAQPSTAEVIASPVPSVASRGIAGMPLVTHHHPNAAGTSAIASSIAGRHHRRATSRQGSRKYSCVRNRPYVPHDEGMGGCPKVEVNRLTDAGDPRCQAN